MAVPQSLQSCTTPAFVSRAKLGWAMEPGRQQGDSWHHSITWVFLSLHKATELLDEGHFMCYLYPQLAFPAQALHRGSPKTPCPCFARSPCSGDRGDVYLLEDHPGRSVMPFARWSAEGAQRKPSANPPNGIFNQGWGQESERDCRTQRHINFQEALEIQTI